MRPQKPNPSSPSVSFLAIISRCTIHRLPPRSRLNLSRVLIETAVEYVVLIAPYRTTLCPVWSYEVLKDSWHNGCKDFLHWVVCRTCFVATRAEVQAFAGAIPDALFKTILDQRTSIVRLLYGTPSMTYTVKSFASCLSLKMKCREMYSTSTRRATGSKS